METIHSAEHLHSPTQCIDYLLYAQAVLQLSFSDKIDSGVEGPLVLTGKDDVGSIEPGYLGNFVINIASVGIKRLNEVRKSIIIQ